MTTKKLLRISDYTRGEFGWHRPDGCYVTDVEDDARESKLLIVMDILGFCGCGVPEDALTFLRDVLRCHDRSGKSQAEWDASFEAQKALLGGNPAEYFIYYWLDAQGLTEHGGGVGASWLTEAGSNLLEDVETALGEPDVDV